MCDGWSWKIGVHNLVQHASWKWARQEQKEQQALRLQGCEPRHFCQRAQQPWQEVSVQTWWSHCKRKHTQTHPHPPPPTPPLLPAHLRVLFSPAENIKVTLVIYVASLRSAGQQSAVFQRVSPLSEKGRGTSIHHALICPRIILHRCMGSVKNNSIFTTLSGFIKFSHSTRRGFKTAVCKHVDQNIQPRVDCSS